MISWVNPDKALGEKTFADYMMEGPLTAMVVNSGDITVDATQQGLNGNSYGDVLAAGISVGFGESIDPIIVGGVGTTATIDLSGAQSLDDVLGHRVSMPSARPSTTVGGSSSTRTNAPNGTSLVTLPGTT